MNKKLLIVSLLFLASVHSSFGQTFAWARSMGGPVASPIYPDDTGNGIATDQIGNVYISGFFSGTVDFDPGPGINNVTSVGTIDMFIQKLDNSGSLVWVRHIGTNNNDNGTDIIIDPDGNIVVTGFFWGTADFDPGSGVSNLTSLNADIFLLKLTSAGNFLWVKQISGADLEAAFLLESDSNGNFYMAGKFAGTVDFDPGPGQYLLTSLGSPFNNFVAKLNSNGNFIFARRFTSASSQIEPHGIDIASNGNICLSGYFNATVNFDPDGQGYSITSNGFSALYVLLLNPNGTFLWLKTVGEAGGIAKFDSQDNIYIAGSFGPGTVDFDPGPGTSFLTSSTSVVDGFLLCLNTNGDFQYVKEFNATNNGRHDVYDFLISDNDELFIAGGIMGTVDFDPGLSAYTLSTSGVRDIFISKYNKDGILQWAKVTGGLNEDHVNSISVLPNSIYATGYFSGTADFDPSSSSYLLTSNGTEDIFVLKLEQSSCPAPAIPLSISGNSSFCPGVTYTYSTPLIPNAVSYLWSLPSGWSGASSSNSISVIAGTNGGVISVAGVNACGTGIQLSMPVNIMTTSIIATGATTFCLGNQVVLQAETGAGITYQWFRNNSLINGSFSDTIKAGLPGSYHAIITKQGCSLNSNSIHVLVNPLTIISSSPQNQTICAGSNINLQVTASGTGTLTYQWRKNGVIINGANASSLTINNASAADGGLYDVVVTGQCNSVESSGATITVNPSTSISSQPESQVKCTGGSVNFQVAANGLNLVYQWRKNGANISGATNSVYSISNLVLTDAGSYDILVSGNCGSMVSAAANLTVNNCTGISDPVNPFLKITLIAVNGIHINQMKAVSSITTTINVEFFDILGREIGTFNWKVTSGENIIPLPEWLNRGLILVRVTNPKIKQVVLKYWEN